jgi:hypothetical protein
MKTITIEIPDDLDISRARIDAGEIAVLSIARLAPGSTVVLDVA